MTATRDVVERRDKIARQADGLEQQVHALRAETLRLAEQQKRLGEEVAFLSKHRDRLQAGVRKAERKLEGLNDAIEHAGPAAQAVGAGVVRDLWIAERYPGVVA